MSEAVNRGVWKVAVTAVTEVQNTDEAFIPADVAKPQIAQDACEAFIEKWGGLRVEDVQFSHEPDGLRLRWVGGRRYGPEDEIPRPGVGP
jgi:hypothetical protein